MHHLLCRRCDKAPCFATSFGLTILAALSLVVFFFFLWGFGDHQFFEPILVGSELDGRSTYVGFMV